jgi:hypothetical protein
MFEEGNILYFDPFYFKNGNPAKRKYFLVLKVNETKTIIAVLPTRTASIPRDVLIERGCLELPAIGLNCFVFPKQETVTTCGKSFDFNTYLYGAFIDDYEVQLFEELYPNEGIDYWVWGKLKPAYFDAVLDCFRHSASVKRKYKRLL